MQQYIVNDRLSFMLYPWTNSFMLHARLIFG